MVDLNATLSPKRGGPETRRERPVRACRQRASPVTGAGVYRPTCASLLPCTEWILHHQLSPRTSDDRGEDENAGDPGDNQMLGENVGSVMRQCLAGAGWNGCEAPDKCISRKLLDSPGGTGFCLSSSLASSPELESPSLPLACTLEAEIHRSRPSSSDEGNPSPSTSSPALPASLSSSCSSSSPCSSSPSSFPSSSSWDVALPSLAGRKTGGWPSTLLDAPAHAEAWSRFYLHHADSRAPFNSFTSRDAVRLLFRLVPCFSLSAGEVMVEVGHGACPLLPFIWMRMRQNAARQRKRTREVRAEAGVRPAEAIEGVTCEVDGGGEIRRAAKTLPSPLSPLSPGDCGAGEAPEGLWGAEGGSSLLTRVETHDCDAEDSSASLAFGSYVGIESCREAAEAALLQGRDLEALLGKCAPSLETCWKRGRGARGAPGGRPSHDLEDRKRRRRNMSDVSTISEKAHAAKDGDSGPELSISLFSESNDVRRNRETSERGDAAELAGETNEGLTEIENGAGLNRRSPQGPSTENDTERECGRSEKEADTCGGPHLREMVRCGCLEFAVCTDGFRYVDEAGRLQLERIEFESLLLTEPCPRRRRRTQPRGRDRDRTQGSPPRGRTSSTPQRGHDQEGNEESDAGPRQEGEGRREDQGEILAAAEGINGTKGKQMEEKANDSDAGQENRETACVTAVNLGSMRPSCQEAQAADSLCLPFVATSKDPPGCREPSSPSPSVPSSLIQSSPLSEHSASISVFPRREQSPLMSPSRSLKEVVLPPHQREQRSSSSGVSQDFVDSSALSFLKPGGAKYVVLKSTLDSVCVMLPCTGTLNWDEDLRIPRQLVVWFDSFARLLKDPPSLSSPVLSSSLSPFLPAGSPSAWCSAHRAPESVPVRRPDEASEEGAPEERREAEEPELAGDSSSADATQASTVQEAKGDSKLHGRNECTFLLVKKQETSEQEAHLEETTPQQEAVTQEAVTRDAGDSGTLGVLCRSHLSAKTSRKDGDEGDSSRACEETLAGDGGLRENRGKSEQEKGKARRRTQGLPTFVSPGLEKVSVTHESEDASTPCVVFLEPRNKARIHLLTIIKVIHSATFTATPSPARFLRLSRVLCPRGRGQEKIIGYLLEKRTTCYASYTELYDDIQRVCRPIQKADPYGDFEDLLPPLEPVKWRSEEPGDIEVLVDYIWSERTAEAMKKGRGAGKGRGERARPPAA
ncbi:hypothetical protein TGCAST_281380 [Toxoplasma gondii CAST]|uniref:Uncharacterized protein n=1 Tax=Toxoplasma gondii CAST TaxID=943122 RepID=A0A425I3Y7_TOXGO|nr:hypothetical protein TGCAST_281380 [Toxoplasma gondii CAST]